jgi:hypothetical protein
MISFQFKPGGTFAEQADDAFVRPRGAETGAEFPSNRRHGSYDIVVGSPP